MNTGGTHEHHVRKRETESALRDARSDIPEARRLFLELEAELRGTLGVDEVALVDDLARALGIGDLLFRQRH